MAQIDMARFKMRHRSFDFRLIRPAPEHRKHKAPAMTRRRLMKIRKWI